MSRTVNLAVLGLKAFTGFWALVTLAVAGALQSEWRGRSDSTGAIIAAGVLTLIWVIASLVLQFVRPETVAISVMVDTIVYGFLFILTLGGTAAESRIAWFYRDWDVGLGSATIGLGWILVLLLLVILVFEVYYTLRSFGGALQTWMTPFHILVADGPSTKTHGNRSGPDTQMGYQSGAPIQPTTQAGPVV